MDIAGILKSSGTKMVARIAGASNSELDEAVNIASKMTGIDMARMIFYAILDEYKEKHKTEDVVLVIMNYNKELKFVIIVNKVAHRSRKGDVFQPYKNVIPLMFRALDMRGELKNFLKITTEILAQNKKIDIDTVECHIGYESLEKMGFDFYQNRQENRKDYIAATTESEFIKFDYFKEYFTA